MSAAFIGIRRTAVGLTLVNTGVETPTWLIMTLILAPAGQRHGNNNDPVRP